MESVGEFAWLRRAIGRSLLSPTQFAGSLVREHYGLASVVVAVLVGAALSLAIDALVLGAKRLSPLEMLPALVMNAAFLAVRMAVTVAIIAAIVHYGLRLARRALTLDQAYTAQSFALTPLLLAPLLMIPAALLPEMLLPALAVTFLLLLRTILGLLLNFAALLPLVLAAPMVAVMLGVGALVLQDEIVRVRFSAYAAAPQLVPEIRATPATGTVFDATDFTLTIPAGWVNQSSGTRGEAARFVSDIGDLRVLRAPSMPLTVAETYADAVVEVEKRGLEQVFSRREYVRVNGVVVIEDTYGGRLDDRRILYRQFTAIPGREGFALIFHYVDSPRGGTLREASAIAATLRIKASR